MEKNEIGITR